MARLLEADEVEPHGRDMFGLPALHKFAAWDKLDLLELLLPRLDGAQLNQLCGAEKRSALHACADMGALRTARRLMDDGRIDARALDGKGRTAKQIAEHAGHAALVELLSR